MANGANAVAGGGGQGGGAAEQPQGMLGKVGQLMMTVIQFYFISTVVRSFMGSGSTPPAAKEGGDDGMAAVAVNTRMTNIWRTGELFDFRVYISNEELAPSDPDVNHNASQIVWEESSISYDWEEDANRGKDVEFPCPEHLHSNGTVFAHVYIKRYGLSFSPGHKYDKYNIAKSFPLVMYRRKNVEKKFKNLLDTSFSEDDEQDTDAESPQQVVEEVEELYEYDEFDDDAIVESDSWLENKIESGEDSFSWSDLAKSGPNRGKPDNRPIVAYWPNSFSLRLVVDQTAFTSGSVPPQIAPALEVVPDNPARYYPIVHHDKFWLLQEHLTELNDTVKILPLKMTYTPISVLKWQMQEQMEESWSQPSWTGEDDNSDEMRRMLLETNPVLLVITIVVTMLHMVFDVLAFKNDIAFWKDQKDMTGLSVRSIFVNCFCSIVIFFYLLDNETSWMILISAGTGIGIEFWKIGKAAKVTYGFSGGLFGVLPWVKIEDKAAYASSPTAKYDKEAMRYLSWALYPLVFGYAIYSLYYEEHKGWYQWVLGSLVGSVYTFGFIMMCPQLYLNYKLKSVAHLPWRMMTYKALNTVIDDLFAFIITMPTMHRLSCFRDDIIFGIFLYQRWIYRIDYSRTNEFGYNPEQVEKLKKEKEEKEAKAKKLKSSNVGDAKAIEPDQASASSEGEDRAQIEEIDEDDRKEGDLDESQQADGEAPNPEDAYTLRRRKSKKKKKPARI